MYFFANDTLNSGSCRIYSTLSASCKLGLALDRERNTAEEILKMSGTRRFSILAVDIVEKVRGLSCTTSEWFILKLSPWSYPVSLDFE